MYQFQRDNKEFWFTTRKEAVMWCLEYVLDNGFIFTEPEQLPNNGWKVEIIADA